MDHAEDVEQLPELEPEDLLQLQELRSIQDLLDLADASASLVVDFLIGGYSQTIQEERLKVTELISELEAIRKPRDSECEE